MPDTENFSLGQAAGGEEHGETVKVVVSQALSKLLHPMHLIRKRRLSKQRLDFLKETDMFESLGGFS